MSEVQKIVLSDGAVRAWIEQGTSVHIKAIEKSGDPVELNEHEVKELAEALLGFYEAICN